MYGTKQLGWIGGMVFCSSVMLFTPGAAAAAPLEEPGWGSAAHVEPLLARMTLAEKIGQMTQVENESITPAEVTRYFIGSVLSGGGGAPKADNSVAGWRRMVQRYQDAALRTRLKIPLLYGVDAVHGHNNLAGATIFPHQIGLGASADAALVEQIGRATAEELRATGIAWTFAPVLAVPQDLRWGRTYEAFGQDPQLVERLGVALIKGLQSWPPAAPGQSDAPAAQSGAEPPVPAHLFVLATAKHFIGDGATGWATSQFTSEGRAYSLDQGDMTLDEAQVRKLLLPPYRAAVAAGVGSIMVSFNSWQGVKLHAHKYLLTDVLKGELGFAGFLVSDWQAIDQLPGSYRAQVAAAINAGLDMVMVPKDFRRFVRTLHAAVAHGEVAPQRIDDAVRRILRVKMALGLFATPMPLPSVAAKAQVMAEGDPAAAKPPPALPPWWAAVVGSRAHLALAREAVRKSVVVLKNGQDAAHPVLPLSKTGAAVFVAGAAADDLGRQCGGWTMSWQGQTGPLPVPATTIVAAIRAAVAPPTEVRFQPDGLLPGRADLGIAVVSELPYAEGWGDTEKAALAPTELAAVRNLRARVRQLVVVVLSGRPVDLSAVAPQADAVVAAWLLGSQGQGVADVLFGDFPLQGRLPVRWPL